MNGRARSGAAFTLIELLVVISIVALLAGMVIGATNTVRAAAQAACCANDLRQAVLALTAYAGDCDGRLVGAVDMTGMGTGTWTRTLVKNGYHDGSDNIFVCPSFQPRKYLINSPGRVRGLHVPAMTVANTPPGAPNAIYREMFLARVPAPSSYLLVADSMKTTYGDGMVNPAQVYNVSAYDVVVPPGIPTEGLYAAHRGRITAAMADGSTTTLSPAQAGDASLPASSRFSIVTVP